jgi:hypothetical protein
VRLLEVFWPPAAWKGRSRRSAERGAMPSQTNRYGRGPSGGCIAQPLNPQVKQVFQPRASARFDAVHPRKGERRKGNDQTTACPRVSPCRSSDGGEVIPSGCNPMKSSFRLGGGPSCFAPREDAERRVAQRALQLQDFRCRRGKPRLDFVGAGHGLAVDRSNDSVGLSRQETANGVPEPNPSIALILPGRPTTLLRGIVRNQLRGRCVPSTVE